MTTPTTGPAGSVLIQFARHSWAGLRLLLLASLVLGGLYPLTVWVVGQGIAPWQANGSVLAADGARLRDSFGAGSADDEAAPVGSALLGQDFTGAGWFHARPSAHDFDALNSGGSNLGPSDPELAAQVERRRADVAKAEGIAPVDVPPDALTASASGLDPDISLAYALIQAARVARERDLPADAVTELVQRHVEDRPFGVLGEPRVNVLRLNIELGKMVG